MITDRSSSDHDTTPQPRGRYRPTKLLLVAIFIATISTWAPTIQGQKVVFEDIGQMASALSYIHVVMPMNLTTIAKRIQQYADVIQKSEIELERIYHTVVNITKTPEDDLQTKGTRIFLRRIYQNQRNITSYHRENTERFQQELDDLFDLFPVSPNGDTGAFSTHTFHVIKRSSRQTNEDLLQLVRDKRSVGLIFSVIKGIAGTFMGLFNRRKMNRLRDDLSDTILRQNRMIGVQALHTAFLAKMETAINHIHISMYYAEIADTAVTDKALTQFERAIADSLRIATNAIQAAQNHRLAIDFLRPEQLQKLYQTILETSKQHQCQLVSEHPSDLFQMELSYLFDNHDITLILHVPMYPKDNLLRLMRFHPFPIPVSENKSLLPLPDQDVLAISPGHHMTMELKYSDLLDCHQVNQVYLCERHGVLSRRFDLSCLGALYNRQHDDALKKCNLIIVEQTETVLQLSENKFLVFSPTGQRAAITCIGDRDRDQSVDAGISEIQIKPECQLKLKDHTLFSDTSIHLEADTLSYDWRWNHRLIEQLQSPNLVEDLQTIASQQRGRLTLDDVLQTAETKRHRSFVITFLIVLAIVAGLIAIGFFIYTFYGHFILRRLYQLIKPVYERCPELPLPPTLRKLLQMQPVPSAPAVMEPIA